VCACFALSSFQRTDRSAPGAPRPTFLQRDCARLSARLPSLSHRPGRAGKASSLSVATRLGEPSEVTSTTSYCQPPKCVRQKKIAIETLGSFERETASENGGRFRRCERFRVLRTESASSKSAVSVGPLELSVELIPPLRAEPERLRCFGRKQRV
jgi:hypothetical protein